MKTKVKSRSKVKKFTKADGARSVTAALRHSRRFNSLNTMQARSAKQLRERHERIAESKAPSEGRGAQMWRQLHESIAISKAGQADYAKRQYDQSKASNLMKAYGGKPGEPEGYSDWMRRQGRDTNGNPLPSNTTEITLSTEEALDILVEAQRRFLDGFTLYYGEALRAAWTTAMADCPVQPGFVSRKELIQFAQWLTGDRATALDRAIGYQMTLILNRLEREIIREQITSKQD